MGQSPMGLPNPPLSGKIDFSKRNLETEKELRLPYAANISVLQVSKVSLAAASSKIPVQGLPVCFSLLNYFNYQPHKTRISIINVITY